MKIAMIGSGAAGSVFASYLRAGGADMTLVDPYKAHMDAVRDNGMKFTIYPDKTTVLTGFKTAYTADEIGTMDIVIFMTKANQLENAIIGAKPCIGPNTVLVSLINGLGNDDKLLKYYPASRCMVGSGVIGTALDGPGGCISTPSEGVIMNFGALENNELTMAAGKYMEDCFNAGGCEAVFREDVLPFIWKKVIVNCTVNTVCAVTRLKIGYVENDPYGQKLFTTSSASAAPSPSTRASTSTPTSSSASTISTSSTTSATTIRAWRRICCTRSSPPRLTP